MMARHYSLFVSYAFCYREEGKMFQTGFGRSNFSVSHFPRCPEDLEEIEKLIKDRDKTGREMDVVILNVMRYRRWWEFWK